MRNFLVILIICIVAGVVGTGLFLYGPPSFHVSFLTTPSVRVTPVAQGDYAAQVSERTNYRIQNKDQLLALWELVYGVETPTVPNVDFTKNEVLAVFDGSHSTTGYAVKIQKVTDTQGKRTVHIVRTSPGAACPTAQKPSSPFEIVMVTATSLPLAHEDVTATTTCL